VPNEVYRAAVAGLSGLVPPRVAQRLVDEALVATRRTPEDVSLPAMRKLLLGPVRKELEGVLPPGAAGPGLKRVAAELEHGGARQRRWWRPGRPGGAEASGERGARRQRPRSPDAPPPTATPPVPALAAAAKAAAVAGPSPSARSTQVRLVEPEEAAAIEAAVAAEAGAPPASAAGVTTVALPARRGPSRWQLERRLEALEEEIGAAEARLDELSGQLAAPDALDASLVAELVGGADGPPPTQAEVLAALGAKHARLEAELLQLMEEWHDITERLSAA